MDPHDEAGTAPEHHAPSFELNPADWTTADEIRRRSFGTSEHGFDPQEVRDYLAKLADWFSDLNVQLSRLRKSQQNYGSSPAAPVAVEAVPAPAPEVGGLAARMADVLREAEEHASRVRADAELRAEQLLAQAREESERLREESDGAIQRARVEAEERLRRANAARDALLAEIRSLRERLGELTGRLESMPIAEETAETPPPARPRVPPPVVLPEAQVDGAEPMVVDAPTAQLLPSPQPASPAQARSDQDQSRAAVDAGAPAGPSREPSASNVRRLPGIDARAVTDPGDLPSA